MTKPTTYFPRGLSDEPEYCLIVDREKYKQLLAIYERDEKERIEKKRLKRLKKLEKYIKKMTLKYELGDE